MHPHVRVVRITLRGISPRQRAISISAVNDVYVMPATAELIGQRMNIDPVSAKVVRRIEGCDHAESQWSVHILGWRR